MSTLGRSDSTAFVNIQPVTYTAYMSIAVAPTPTHRAILWRFSTCGIDELGWSRYVDMRVLCLLGAIHKLVCYDTNS